MKVSMRQLAAHCGVSIGTVDRVLNNRSGVKEQTRKLVEQAVLDLGYTTNYLAKSLSVGKTSSIGVVLFNLQNLFFAQMSDAIVKEADSFGYFPYLTLSEKNKQKEFECVRNLVARQVDGIILFSTNNDPDFIEYLSSCGVPVVMIMTQLAGFPSVGIDDFNAMSDAAGYIASKQYRRIIYISPPLSYSKHMNVEVQKQRCAGFLNAMKNWETEHIIIDDSNFIERIDQLDITSHKTAFLCSSDVYALDILSHMRLKGLLSPYHYGLMGFDNIGILQYVDPVISTVSIPIEDAGREAVNILLRKIEGETVDSVRLPHKIIQGQTIV